MAKFRRDVAAVLKAGPDATKTYVATGKLTTTNTTAGGKTMAEWTEAELRAMMQAEEEEILVRMWVAPTGTGTAMRNLQVNMKLQLDRIENAIAALDSNDLVVRELDAGGLTAESRELVTALENSVADLEQRPSAAQLAEFLNTDGTMSPAPTESDS
jgi:hypothetical protein